MKSLLGIETAHRLSAVKVEVLEKAYVLPKRVFMIRIARELVSTQQLMHLAKTLRHFDLLFRSLFGCDPLSGFF